MTLCGDSIMHYIRFKILTWTSFLNKIIKCNHESVTNIFYKALFVDVHKHIAHFSLDRSVFVVQLSSHPPLPPPSCYSSFLFQLLFGCLIRLDTSFHLLYDRLYFCYLSKQTTSNITCCLLAHHLSMLLDFSFSVCVHPNIFLYLYIRRSCLNETYLHHVKINRGYT